LNNTILQNLHNIDIEVLKHLKQKMIDIKISKQGVSSEKNILDEKTIKNEEDKKDDIDNNKADETDKLIIIN